MIPLLSHKKKNIRITRLLKKYNYYITTVRSYSHTNVSVGKIIEQNPADQHYFESSAGVHAYNAEIHDVFE